MPSEPATIDAGPSPAATLPTTIILRTPQYQGVRARSRPLPSSSLPNSSPSHEPSSSRIVVLPPHPVPRSSDRPARSSSLSHNLSSESPTSSTFMASSVAGVRRKRSFAAGPGYDGAADDESKISKGGHSLRKRTRIDYTQEIIEDGVSSEQKPEMPAKTTPAPSARGRKKKTAYDHSDEESDGFASTSQRRRRTVTPALGTVTTPSASSASRRKNPARRTVTEPRSYIEQPSDNEVQDTIEVGGAPGDVPSSEDHSEFHQSDSASVSSERSNTQLESIQPDQPAEIKDELDRANAASSERIRNDRAAIIENEDLRASPDAISVSDAALDAHQDDDQISAPVAAPAPASSGQELHAEVAQAEIRPVENTEDSQQPEAAEIQPKSEDQRDPSPSPLSQAPAIVEAQALSNSTEPLGKSASLIAEPAEQHQSEQPKPETVAPGASVVPTQSKTEKAAEEETPQRPVEKPAEELVEQHTERSPKKPAQAGGKQKTESFRDNVSEKPAHIVMMQLAENSIDNPADDDEEAASSYPLLTPYVKGQSSLYPKPRVELVDLNQKEAAATLETPAPTPSTFSDISTSALDSWDAKKMPKMGQFADMWARDRKDRRARGLELITMKEFQAVLTRRILKAREEETLSKAETAEAKDEPVKKGRGRGRGRAPKAGIAADRQHSEPGDRSARLRERNADSPATDTPQAADSQQATAAPSPEPEQPEEEPQPGAHPEAENQAAAADDNEAPAAGPTSPQEILVPPKKQYSFPSLQDIAAFSDALDGFENMPKKQLYDVLAAANNTLVTWAREYNALRKALDDEDNAPRRQLNDKTVANWEAKLKLGPTAVVDTRNSFGAEFKPKHPPSFVINGVRAPKPYVDDPLLERQKQEDRIMADAYGFVLRENKVGQQDPLNQRYDQPETDTRNRRQTQKAADAAAEDVGGIETRRTRRPRTIADQSNVPSRSSTPVPTKARPRRARAGAGLANGADGNEASASANGYLAPEDAIAKPRSARIRGRNKANADDAAFQPDEDTPAEDGPPRATRRRGRVSTKMLAAQDEEAGQAAQDEDEPVQPRRRGRKSLNVMDEIPPSSFYGKANRDPPPPDDDDEQSRPSTSASGDTANTADSSYSLRPNRKRNFAVENDPELEGRPKKRTRAPLLPAPATRPTDEPKKRNRGARKIVPAHQPAPIAPYPGQGFIYNMPPSAQQNNPFSGPHPPPPLPSLDFSPYHHPGHPPPPSANSQAYDQPSAPRPTYKIKLNVNGINKSGDHSLSSTPPATGYPVAPPPNRVPLPSAGQSGPSAAPADKDNDASGKPYAEMSKSEKMSLSMKSKNESDFKFQSSTPALNPKISFIPPVVLDPIAGPETGHSRRLVRLAENGSKRGAQNEDDDDEPRPAVKKKPCRIIIISAPKTTAAVPSNGQSVQTAPKKRQPTGASTKRDRKQASIAPVTANGAAPQPPNTAIVSYKAAVTRNPRPGDDHRLAWKWNGRSEDAPYTFHNIPLAVPFESLDKQQKMSLHAYRRWASGAMQGAVDKRKVTLAKQKEDREASRSVPGPHTPVAPRSNSNAGSGSASGRGKQKSAASSARGTPAPTVTPAADLDNQVFFPPPPPPPSAANAV